MLRFSVLVLVGVLACVAAAQDGPIIMKFKKAGPGDKARVTSAETDTSTTTTVVQGNETVKKETREEKGEYTQETVEKAADGSSSKVKKTYKSVQSSLNGTAADVGLDGKTVVIERKGKEHTFTYPDGKAVTGAAADFLKRAHRQDKEDSREMLMPKKPIKVGETWELDREFLVKEFAENFDIDAEKVKATGKLLKAETKDGALFGTMEIDISLPITALKSRTPIPTKPGSVMTMKLNLEGCIDGTRDTGGGTMKLDARIDAEVMGATIKVVAAATKEQHTTELK